MSATLELIGTRPSRSSLYLRITKAKNPEQQPLAGLFRRLWRFPEYLRLGRERRRKPRTSA